jgi:hypothetical protein
MNSVRTRRCQKCAGGRLAVPTAQKNMLKVTYHFLEPDGWSRSSSNNGVRGWGVTVLAGNGGFPVLAIIEIGYADRTHYSIGLSISDNGKPAVRVP